MTESNNMLNSITIASPCSADWDEMDGDQRCRFCKRCEKHVYNLSGMSQDEAESLVRDTEGGVCVRFYRRPDGTMLTADCPVGKIKATRRLRRFFAIAAALMGLAAIAPLVTAHGSTSQPGVNRAVPVVQYFRKFWNRIFRPAPAVIMGEICPATMGKIMQPTPTVQPTAGCDATAE